jgi:UDP-glucuronate 4-epimerase
MKILITGAAGFIGFHLSNYLSNKRHQVYGLDNFSSLSFKTQKLRRRILKNNKKINFIKVDLKNLKFLLKSFENIKIDLVIHLAAQPGVRISQKQPDITVDQNIKNFVNILEFCKEKKIKNLFYASSSSVYGESKFFDENIKLKNTTSVYGASKLCDEIMASTYNYLYNINTLGLRFFTVYGPFGREDMAYYKFLEQISSSKKITIYGSTKSVRSFTYIDDVTKALSSLIDNFSKKRKYNDCLNIGNIKKDSLQDLIKIIEKKFSRNFKKIILKRNKSDMFRTAASTKKLNKLINFYPKVSLNEGMETFISWYNKYILKNLNKCIK